MPVFEFYVTETLFFNNRTTRPFHAHRMIKTGNILYRTFVGYFRVSQKFRKWGKCVEFLILRQSFLAIFEVSYRK